MFSTITTLLAAAKTRIAREETGATAVEYGLIVGLIAVVIITAVGLLGGTLSDLFNNINNQLP